MTAATAPIETGATVFVETSHALPLVSVTVAERTGAIEDPAGKEGLSRFVSRLMRRTAGGRSTEAIDEALDAMGGTLGVDVGHSVLSFHGTVIRRSLGPFVELLSSLLATPDFAGPERERLKRETLAELIEVRDHDRSLARRWFRHKLFESHPYGRMVGGTSRSVSGFSEEDATALYARTVQSENLVFSFAGDVSETEAHDIAARLRGAVTAGPARADEVDDPTVPLGRRLVFVDKPERTQTQILIGGLGTHPRDDDHTALLVANTVFGGTFTARLMQEVRSKRGWSYGASSSLPYDRHRRGFSMWTFPKAEDAAPCIRLELDLLKSWHDRGITKSELEWAKRYLVRSHAFSVDTAEKRVALAVEEALYDLPAGYHATYLERVRAVTVDEANAAVQKRIDPDRLLVTVVGTESEIGDAVREAIDGLSSQELVPYDSEP